MSNTAKPDLKSLLAAFKYQGANEPANANVHKILKPSLNSKRTKKIKRNSTISYENLADLPPSLNTGLSVVFVGYNPGVKSSETQHHYAHHSNRFWKLFNDSKILDASVKYFPPRETALLNEVITAENDYELVDYGIGFTDLVLRATRSIQELSSDEMRLNVPRLIKEFSVNKPRIVCFVGKGIWETIIKSIMSDSKTIIRQFQWGKQKRSKLNDMIGYDVILYVVPNTSGLVSIKYEIKLDLWKKMADDIDQLIQ